MSAARLALLFGCALSLHLPAPELLSMRSVNMQHTLSWTPGPGTPPGASYLICDAEDSTRPDEIQISTKTSAELTLDAFIVYHLVVIAMYNHSRSPPSQKLVFAPYKDTILGPPKVLLAGCDACLHVSVVLAGGGGGSGKNLHGFYKPTYILTIRNKAEQRLTYKRSNFTVLHLHRNTEYCIRVNVSIVLNQNTHPSGWTCAFTSGPQPNTGPPAGLLAGLGVFLVGALALSVFCLTYMGFICRLPTVLPTVLLGLRPGHTLTPERTVPDQLSISPKVQKYKHDGPAGPQPAEEEEEEEEEEDEERRYMVGNLELSSDESPGPAADGLHVAHLHLQCEEDEDEDEGEGEGEEVGHSEVQEDGAEGEEASEAEELEEEQVLNSSGGINLLSVMLGALVRREEEEQELPWTDQEPLLSHDQTSRSVRTSVEDQSPPEEEEEEFSGYLRHS